MYCAPHAPHCQSTLSCSCPTPPEHKCQHATSQGTRHGCMNLMQPSTTWQHTKLHTAAIKQPTDFPGCRLRDAGCVGSIVALDRSVQAQVLLHSDLQSQYFLDWNPRWNDAMTQQATHCNPCNRHALQAEQVVTPPARGCRTGGRRPGWRGWRACRSGWRRR